jgi:hypothetical protein
VSLRHVIQGLLGLAAVSHRLLHSTAGDQEKCPQSECSPLQPSTWQLNPNALAPRRYHAPHESIRRQWCFTILLDYPGERVYAHVLWHKLTQNLHSVVYVFLYPAYGVYKALQRRPPGVEEQQAQEAERRRWLEYWAVMAFVLSAEYAAEWLVSW